MAASAGIGDLRTALLVVLVFAVLGPPVGALAFGVMVAAAAPFFAPDDGLGLLVLYGVVLLLPVAWMVGGLQAVLTGAATALWSWRHGAVPLRIPLIAACVLAAISVARSGETLDVAVLLFAAHPVAAAASWLVCARLLGWPARF